jgi:hypothetical protein
MGHELGRLGRPRYAVDTRRGVPLGGEIAPRQEVVGDVMQQCGEPYTLALSRRSAHGVKAGRRGIPVQRPGRGRLVAVPLGRGPGQTRAWKEALGHASNTFKTRR